MTHTPGPWRIGDAGHSVFPPKEIFAQKARAVASNLTRGDARLIAAAPKMLEALKAIIADSTAVKDLPQHHWERCCAAIAEAEGKS